MTETSDNYWRRTGEIDVAKVFDPKLAAPVVEVTCCMPSVFATLNVFGELITALSSIFG
jgi:hypothetical protein